MFTSALWKSEQAHGLTFIGPALILFGIFVFYPAFYIFYAGLFDWDGINPGEFIWFQNYREIFTSDRSFWLSIRNSLYWAPLTIVPQMVLGFTIAYLLEIKTPFVVLFRAIFYIPAIISPIVIGIIWQRIYNPFGGLLSDVGRATGLSFLSFPFLADTGTAIFAVIVVNFWQWMGFSMLLYIAGMQGISKEVLESARLDGVKHWQTAVFVVWPMLKHVHLTLVLLGIIGTMQTFPLIYIMTNGGPNHATEMLPNHIFQEGFILQNMGYASALSVVLLLLSLGLSIFQVKVLGAKFAIGGNA
ncbi:MAG: sugar ABC transporter permease [Pseudomonadota bacterium]